MEKKRIERQIEEFNEEFDGDSNTLQGKRNSKVKRNSDALFSSNENRAASYCDLIDSWIEQRLPAILLTFSKIISLVYEDNKDLDIITLMHSTHPMNHWLVIENT